MTMLMMSSELGTRLMRNDEVTRLGPARLWHEVPGASVYVVSM